MLADEYFEHLEKFSSEYGEKTSVLMQDGAFYEILMIDNENEKLGTVLYDISDVLNIAITRKNKSLPYIDRSNPAFAGFPLASLAKFLPVLLENGYTVVVIEECQDLKGNGKKQSKKRCIKGVYSPSLQPIDLVQSITSQSTGQQKNSGGDNVTAIVLQLGVSGVSSAICNMNMTTNVMEVQENYTSDINLSLDSIYKGILQYNSKEILINVIDLRKGGEFESKLSKEYIENYLNIHENTVHFKVVDKVLFLEQSKLQYQELFFKKIYKHIDFGMLGCIEYFGLEKHQLSSYTVIVLLEFISRHDMKYVQNIAPPCLQYEREHLSLELNTLQQLSVVNVGFQNKSRYSSLYDVINKTKTSIGKRGLRNILCKPFKSVDEITRRYEFMDALEENIELLDGIRKSLDGMCDVERLHRKMGLCSLHPFELASVLVSYKKVIDLYQKFAEMNDERIQRMISRNENGSDNGQKMMNMLLRFVEDCERDFNIEELRKNTMNETGMSVSMYFNKGVIEMIDKTVERMTMIEHQMEELRLYYEKKLLSNGKVGGDWIKQVYSDSEGYVFTCTKIRSQLLQKTISKTEMNESGLVFKNNTSVSKFTCKRLVELSGELVSLRSSFCNAIKKSYLEYTSHLYQRYNSVFEQVVRFVEIVDLSQSNLKCKSDYNYCRPTIIESQASFLDAKDLRHPIIERINDSTEYIPNDVTLDNSKNGMILYALNACGKSSLLRSIGLAIILAQSGMYVPSSKFVFSPFDTVVSQVEMQDNLWKSQSSFVSEMVGLRRICGIADERCLVLSDELTKGTEVISATSIFAASVLCLLERGAKFVFTTHLQDVAKIQKINTHSRLRICHLSVDIKDDNILFSRKLQDGPCSELYGLEVARAVGLEKNLIEEAFQIRSDLLEKSKNIVNAKKSRYNKKKILDSCEVCEYCPVSSMDLPLDTHHIKFQCTADENNFNSHFHKHSLHNLVALCKTCHIKVHNGEITINGYIQSTNGVYLEYKKQQKN